MLRTRCKPSLTWWRGTSPKGEPARLPGHCQPKSARSGRRPTRRPRASRKPGRASRPSLDPQEFRTEGTMQRLILATAVTVLLAPISLAQTSSTTGTGSGAGASTAAPAPAGPDLTRASRVLREDVYNPNGDAVGSIDELVVAPDWGQIQRVGIGVGGRRATG